MNDRQTAIANMLAAARKFGQEQNSVLSTIPEMNDAYGLFTARHDLLLKDIIAMQGGGGDAAAKAEVKGQLCKSTVLLTKPALVYASKTGNAVLKAGVDVSKSDLEDMKETDLEAKVQSILDAVASVAASLTPFGYKAALATAVAALLGQFKELKPAPRLTRTLLATHTKNIKEGISALTTLLEERLDPLVPLLEETYPDFVTQWAGVRKIIDPAYRARKAKAEAKKAGEVE